MEPERSNLEAAHGRNGHRMRNKIVVVSGFRGSGKSTVSAGILRRQTGIILRDPNEDDAYSFIPNTLYSIADLKHFSVICEREKRQGSLFAMFPTCRRATTKT